MIEQTLVSSARRARCRRSFSPLHSHTQLTRVIHTPPPSSLSPLLSSSPVVSILAGDLFSRVAGNFECPSVFFGRVGLRGNSRENYPRPFVGIWVKKRGQCRSKCLRGRHTCDTLPAAPFAHLLTAPNLSNFLPSPSLSVDWKSVNTSTTKISLFGPQWRLSRHHRLLPHPQVALHAESPCHYAIWHPSIDPTGLSK